MAESSLYEPRVRSGSTPPGFGVTARWSDDTIELVTEPGTSADRVSLALTLYVPPAAHLRSVDMVDGRPTLKFVVPSPGDTTPAGPVRVEPSLDV